MCAPSACLMCPFNHKFSLIYGAISCEFDLITKLSSRFHGVLHLIATPFDTGSDRYPLCVVMLPVQRVVALLGRLFTARIEQEPLLI